MSLSLIQHAEVDNPERVGQSYVSRNQDPAPVAPSPLHVALILQGHLNISQLLITNRGPGTISPLPTRLLRMEKPTVEVRTRISQESAMRKRHGKARGQRGGFSARLRA